MSRKIKNIIMIILIIVLCVAMYFTISYPKNNFKNENQMSEMGNSEDFKNMQENKGEMGERPTMPTENNGEMAEPPEKPEGEEQLQSENSTERNMQRQNRPENMNGEMPSRGNAGKNNFVVNILVGVEGLLISVILMYLIMSKFNKLTFKETFSKGSKIITYVILVIVIAAGIIVLTMYLNGNTIKMEAPVMNETREEKETITENINVEENVTETESNL